MALSRPRQRTRSLLILGLVLSVLIHLLGGELWGFLFRTLARVVPKPITMASLQDPPQPRADVIRLERRAAPAARAAHENRVMRVAPRPHPVETVAPALPQPKHEIAHPRVHAPAQPRVDRAAQAIVNTPRRIRPVAMARIPDNKPAYSDRQLAQLGQQFSKSIADSRESLGDVQAASERAPVATVKHYAVHFSGIHAGMNPGDGEIFPISKQRIGNTMWYYTRYTYMHGDGTYEADTIPWPFHYPVGDDPFARGDKRVPIEPPPEGYKPDRPLKPILEQFFGGPPVTD